MKHKQIIFILQDVCVAKRLLVGWLGPFEGHVASLNQIWKLELKV
jgi:hypothetical protein